MSANKSCYKSQHKKLHFILVVRFFKLCKKSFNIAQRIEQSIYREEISSNILSSLSQFLSFLCLNCPFKVPLLCLCQFTLLLLLQLCYCLISVTRILTHVFFHVIIKKKEELASSSTNFRIIVHDSLPDGIDCFLIIPDAAFIQFNHDIQ